MSRDARILVADDEPLVLRALTRALARYAVVSCVQTLDDMLALIGEGERFDLILLDLSLASTTELTGILARIDVDQARRIVLHTGDHALRERGSGLPDSIRVLSKPASGAQMAALLDGMLATYGPAKRDAA